MQQLSLFELWHHMGTGARTITCTMLLMSVASLVIVCERLVVLTASNKRSLSLVLPGTMVWNFAGSTTMTANTHLYRNKSAAVPFIRAMTNY